MKLFGYTMMAGLLCLSTVPANAQSAYPAEPIEILVGYSAGGPVDSLARQMAPFLEKHLDGDADVAIINKPGASGMLMYSELANATPDGYTLGLFSHPALFTILFGREKPYSVDSFEYLGVLTEGPHSLVVGPNSEYDSLDQLVEAARAAPGTINIGGAGIGTAAHLALKVFERAADVKFNFIPAAGASETLNQVMGGHIVGGFTSASGAIPMHEEGQVRMLGIMKDERLPEAPEIPTFVEQGYPAEWGTIRGIAAPAGTPPEIVQKLSDAVAAVTDDPEFVEAAKRQNIQLSYRDGDAFRRLAGQQLESLEEIWETDPWQ